MADYTQGKSNGVRPNDYGQAPASHREAAYSNIFGSAPPPGRSQTMTSTSFNPGAIPQNRTQTMASHSPGMPNGMQRPPPPRQQQTNGYGPLPTMSGPMSSGGQMQNGYYAGQRQPNGNQVQSQPQPHHLPQPSRPDRRYASGPQRIEQRGPHPQYPTTRPIPQRYGPNSSPALASDSYRSQSMASSVTRPAFHPPQTYPQQAPANAFRQAPYQQSSSTTAQGRIVPQRHDERAMSMTNHAQAHDMHQYQQQQMSSGRVIPARRTSQSGPSELQGSNGYDYGRTMSMASTTAGDMSRSMSMASTITSTERTDSLAHRPSLAKSISSGTRGRRSINVYPALLSAVGEYFQMDLQQRTNDKTVSELLYRYTFTGSEAVDLLALIIKTTDRNLALLLGRSLDAQRLFHHIKYEHRLRDSPNEYYQFQTTVMDAPSEGPEINGVFVLLSECYSPTCTKDALCYSIACPRRLEQQSRLNLKPQGGLRRQESRASLHDEIDEPDEQKLWINTVSQDVANSVSDREKKRQEVISEIMYTERDFVKDLEYLRDFWINPLRLGTPSMASPIPEPRREKIVRTVFCNIIDHPSIHSVSSRFAEALTERQKKEPVVKEVGDIFLQYVRLFEPFIVYGSNQLAAKHEFEKERSLNPYFAKFVDETERRKESRKLELNGYLTKPTTRLARYPLLLDNVLKYTDPDSPDIRNIPKAMVMIRDFLSQVNEESGKAENRFNLKQLHENLRWKPNERVDLKLTEDGRELLHKGPLKKALNDPSDITTYLFDHAVLFVRTKMVGKKEEVKVYRRPIPLELLTIKEMDEVIPKMGIAKRPSSSLLANTKANGPDPSKAGFPITFVKIGRNAYELTLYAGTPGGRKKWMELIGGQQELLATKGNFYNQNEISTGFFSAVNRVNCVAPFDGGRKLIYGTDNGIFVSDRRNKDASVKPRKALEAQNVVQIDVLEEYQLILVLANKTLYSYSLSALDPNEAALNKRPKKIQGHCNFFKTGVCLGRHLVCCVKSSALSTTIKVFEPNDAMSKGKKQKNFFNLKTGGPDELKSFKEFYIPTESSSIHFLKSKLCVACARGFEVVSLETLETQSLLDQADTSLDFVARKEGNIRPIHIERLNGEFLLNYSDFSFFVNRNGWRARPEWKIDWEGQPQNFALMYPWILAFEPNFIEIRNIEDNTVHIVQGKNIRMLHSSTREILYAYEDDRSGDIVASIDFWPAEQQIAHPVKSSPQAPQTQTRR